MSKLRKIIIKSIHQIGDADARQLIEFGENIRPILPDIHHELPDKAIFNTKSDLFWKTNEHVDSFVPDVSIKRFW
ncbi:MAG: hypothetical protein COB90_06315 [Hyphomicrobiales bacterium]|nr:MAG: hypothetical protein COB90_06315 [Hyphomicrobiales bacterium]